MTHCRCCQMPLFHPLSIGRKLCSTCFMGMDARLLKAAAREQHEIDTLESWWNSTLEGANR